MESIKNNPILVFQPNPVENLRKKYNMDNGRMEQSLDLLQEWIKKQRHFTCHDFDREYLERSIICCKGSLEKAKKQTDRVCTLRTLVPKFFITEDVRNNLKDLFELGCFVISPKQNKDYQRAMIVKISDRDFSSQIFMDFYRYNVVMCEYLKSHDFTDGYQAVIDLREVNLLEVTKKFNPVDVQQILTVMIVSQFSILNHKTLNYFKFHYEELWITDKSSAEGYGAVIKGIHLMSHSKVIDLLIKSVKPFLSQKIADRIHVNQENEELHSIIDRDLLPIEYGGNERSIYELNEMWYDEISSPKFEAYLAKMKSMCTNETLRLTEKFNEDCVGLPGSFRTLSVD